MRARNYSLCRTLHAGGDGSGCVVASLIGNASGQTFGAERGPRSEAFSMRRLGGSRWRLRRTRCAMGFERQRGCEQSLGRGRRGKLPAGSLRPSESRYRHKGAGSYLGCGSVRNRPTSSSTDRPRDRPCLSGRMCCRAHRPRTPTLEGRHRHRFGRFSRR